VCWAAADSGHLEVLQYLYARGFEWDDRTCANGCPWDEETLTETIIKCITYEGKLSMKHVEVVKWACLNGCPWGEKTLELLRR
jgi:hypothetical protein